MSRKELKHLLWSTGHPNTAERSLFSSAPAETLDHAISELKSAAATRDANTILHALTLLERVDVTGNGLLAKSDAVREVAKILKPLAAFG